MANDNFTAWMTATQQAVEGALETLLPDGGTELIIYDYRESRIIGRIKLGNVE